MLMGQKKSKCLFYDSLSYSLKCQAAGLLKEMKAFLAVMLLIV